MSDDFKVSNLLKVKINYDYIRNILSRFSQQIDKLSNDVFELQRQNYAKEISEKIDEINSKVSDLEMQIKDCQIRQKEDLILDSFDEQFTEIKHELVKSAEDSKRDLREQVEKSIEAFQTKLKAHILPGYATVAMHEDVASQIEIANQKILSLQSQFENFSKVMNPLSIPNQSISPLSQHLKASNITDALREETPSKLSKNELCSEINLDVLKEEITKTILDTIIPKLCKNNRIEISNSESQRKEEIENINSPQVNSDKFEENSEAPHEFSNKSNKREEFLQNDTEESSENNEQLQINNNEFFASSSHSKYDEKECNPNINTRPQNTTKLVKHKQINDSLSSTRTFKGNQIKILSPRKSPTNAQTFDLSDLQEIKQQLREASAQPSGDAKPAHRMDQLRNEKNLQKMTSANCANGSQSQEIWNIISNFHLSLKAIGKRINNLESSSSQYVTFDALNEVMNELSDSLCHTKSNANETAAGRTSYRCLLCGRPTSSVKGMITEKEVAGMIGEPPISCVSKSGNNDFLLVYGKDKIGYRASTSMSPKRRKIVINRK